MWPTLFSLLGLALLVQLWSSAARAREAAQALAARICADAGVQLLDQSVALREIRPVRAPWGLALRRRYSFDYSIDGVGRERGFLVYLGPSLESASVPTRPPEA
jgi:hypothetical protein